VAAIRPLRQLVLLQARRRLFGQDGGRLAGALAGLAAGITDCP